MFNTHASAPLLDGERLRDGLHAGHDLLCGNAKTGCCQAAVGVIVSRSRGRELPASRRRRNSPQSLRQKDRACSTNLESDTGVKAPAYPPKGHMSCPRPRREGPNLSGRRDRGGKSGLMPELPPFRRPLLEPSLPRSTWRTAPLHAFPGYPSRALRRVHTAGCGLAPGFSVFRVHAVSNPDPLPSRRTS